MKGSSLATMAWRNLWRNRRRTYITLSAIVFGVFLSIVMMAMQDRNWADMIRLAARLGAGHVTLQHPEYLDSPTMTRTVQGTGRLKRLAADDERVIRVVERITGFNMLATARENVGAGFIAVSPEQEDDETLSLLEAIVEGEFFESSTDRGIILGEKLASNLDVELGSKLVYTLTDKDGEIVSALARVSGIVRTGSLFERAGGGRRAGVPGGQDDLERASSISGSRQKNPRVGVKVWCAVPIEKGRGPATLHTRHSGQSAARTGLSGRCHRATGPGGRETA